MIRRQHLTVIEYETCNNGCGTELFELSEDKGELYHGFLFWPAYEDFKPVGYGYGTWLEVFTCSLKCHKELQGKTQGGNSHPAQEQR